MAKTSVNLPRKFNNREYYLHLVDVQKEYRGVARLKDTFEDLEPDYYTPRRAQDFHPILAALRTWLGSEKGTVVHLACGYGQLLPWLRREGHKPIGIDLSQKNLLLAKRKRKIRGIVVADSRRLPLSRNSAVAVVSDNFLGSDYPPIQRKEQKIFGEAYRVLKPGGILIIHYGFASLLQPPFSKWTMHEVDPATIIAISRKRR